MSKCIAKIKAAKKDFADVMQNAYLDTNQDSLKAEIVKVTRQANIAKEFFNTMNGADKFYNEVRNIKVKNHIVHTVENIQKATRILIIL